MSGDATPDNSESSRARIDTLCDAFEDLWRNGPRPQLLDFITQGSEDLQPKLFYELLVVELELRRNAGEKPTKKEYLDKYPAFAKEIEAAAFNLGASAFISQPTNSETPEERESLKEGLRVSHYQLVEKIGEGAMGEVWKATDTRLNRLVAIKLPKSQTLTEAELRRFQREGQAVGKLKHPQLAAVHDIGRWGDSAYIVVDYVEGENLKKRLERGKISRREIVEICADIAEALHHAHERGVVHRDLKPANIIVDPQGRSHVIDFGLAKWTTDEHDLTLHGELLGTPAYMSPEQARGDGANAGPATDIYSLGVILYEMLTGECPFTGGHGTVLHQIANATPVSPRQKMADVPRDLETICLKALEKEPLQRFKTLQEMAVDLRRFERGEPILTNPPGSAENAWRWVKRHPTLLAAALIGVFAFGVTLLWISSKQTIRAMEGYQEVSLDTDPSGARVTFARLSNIGEIISDQVIQGGLTPAHVELLPGDYFVEAVWPDGRFNEVLRRVPSGSEQSRTNFKHLQSSGSGSTIVLPDIAGPSSDVDNGMNEFSMDDASKANSVQSGKLNFLADPHNLTVGDIRFFIRKNQSGGNSLLAQMLASDDLSGEQDSADALEAFDHAVSLAERLGKRLPTNLEYQRLAELQGPESLAHSADGASDIGRSLKVELIRYTAPYKPKGFVRFVRSKHPRFALEK